MRGSSFEDLCERICFDYFDHSSPPSSSTQKGERKRDKSSVVDWLANRDLMQESPEGIVCTIAGIALFGKHPSRMLPQASFRLAVFSGPEKAGQRVPRNHNIINVLRDYGLMEHQGMGIRRTVIPAMLEHNGTELEFEATEDFFKVTLLKKADK